MSEIYNEEYYANYFGAVPYEDPFWAKGFDGMGQLIVDTIHPTSCLEIGCAMGYLVTALRKRGVDAYGIDISEYAISKVHSETAKFCQVYSALDGLPAYFPQRYDLVVCIEVAEHLSADEGEILISKMCSYADKIIFSSTPDDVTEPTHHNVQKPSYWTRLFANYNFYQDFAMRPQYVSPQAMFLTRGQNIPDVISNYEEQIYQLHKEHHNALQDLLSDRKKAQEIMDIQKEELDRLRSDFSLLQADRGVAQKIMDTQQAELERTRNEASLLRADRGEAQKIMDTQHREVEQLRQSFAALQKDREEAQKIMDVQQAEMERLRSDFSLLLEDREKAQKIMDTQRVLLNNRFKLLRNSSTQIKE